MPSRRLRYNVGPKRKCKMPLLGTRTCGLASVSSFVDAVNRRTDEILEAPKRWRLVAGTRRVLMGRFPYGIVYREISDDEVEIVAVAHLKRRPGYWARR